MEIRNSPLKKDKADPIDKKQEVQESNDKHIDQDFEGYPHNPAREEIIRPETDTARKTATAGENRSNVSQRGSKMEDMDKESNNAQRDNGSAGAFEATEQVGDDNKDGRFIEKNGRKGSRVY